MTDEVANVMAEIGLAKIAELESANAALRDERDAWMATYDAIRKEWEDTLNFWMDAGILEEKPLDELIKQTPPISLAKRDARVMREAAEIAKRNAQTSPGDFSCGCAMKIEARAAELEGSIGSDTHA